MVLSDASDCHSNVDCQRKSSLEHVCDEPRSLDTYLGNLVTNTIIACIGTMHCTNLGFPVCASSEYVLSPGILYVRDEPRNNNNIVRTRRAAALTTKDPLATPPYARPTQTSRPVSYYSCGYLGRCVWVCWGRGCVLSLLELCLDRRCRPRDP